MYVKFMEENIYVKIKFVHKLCQIRDYTKTNVRWKEVLLWTDSKLCETFNEVTLELCPCVYSWN